LVTAGLVEKLRSQLRRDPSDGDVAFLLSLAVRDPFVVYAPERERLRRLADVPFRRTARASIVAEAAAELLEAALRRRPESGTMAVVREDRVPSWRLGVPYRSGARRARAKRLHQSRR
jgi:hypothetical protein